MSGRIRQLKPDFLLDEEFWALKSAHPDLHLHEAFEGLWCHADREGRFEWRPQMLKAKILPYWQGDFARALEVLTDAGLVVTYEAEGKRYGWVRSFGKHQRPNSREPASALPPPPVRAPSPDVSVRVQAPADESPRAALPPLPTPNTQPQHPTHASVPEVPGLVVVANDRPPLEPPKRLGPSKRERELTAQAESLGQRRHSYTPGWIPVRANQARAQELGISDEELWERWELKKDKHYDKPFTDDERQFNCELAWLAADKRKNTYQSKRDREAFELPGRERRAGS
jgi:hypothetical protein